MFFLKKKLFLLYDSRTVELENIHLKSEMIKFSPKGNVVKTALHSTKYTQNTIKDYVDNKTLIKG